MLAFRYGCRRSINGVSGRNATSSCRWTRAASRISIPTPPPFPVIESCPVSTCQCRELPQGLDIDREAPLNNTIAAYAEQILISTGRSDWKSRIEEDEEAAFVRQLKNLLGRGGKYSDPFHNVLITNTSFSPTNIRNQAYEDQRNPRESAKPKPGVDSDVIPDEAPESPPASAFLMPSFQYVPSIPTDQKGVEEFLQGFVLPSKLHASHDNTTRQQRNILKRQPEIQSKFTGARKVDEIVILICGHGGRDQRCGVLGPLLMAEFKDKLERQGITVLEDSPPLETPVANAEVEGYTPHARIASISHIGGHKFAGNVIIYIPPSFGVNALNGKGIWYGRVEPRHVEGIVDKTVVGGKVIKELFRGGIGREGEMLRL